VAELDLLGIDSVAQNVYLAMVSEPYADATKLAERLDIADAAVHEALLLLERLSLIVPGDRASGYAPVDPEVGLSAILARRHAELAKRQEEYEGCRLEVASLLAACGRREEGRIPGVEWISGEDQVWQRVEELAEVCERELACLGPTERPSGSVLEALRSVDETVTRRGGRIRSLLLESVRNDASAMPYLRGMMGRPDSARTLPSLPVWMIMADRRHLVLPMASDRVLLGALVCRAEPIVNAFAALFAKLWKEASPLAEARARTGGRLSQQEWHILRLWAQGMTDASAARHMDVSLRTVRRLSDRLTERFGAQSRFQLGAMAVAAGSIRSEDML
jgi:DNA-binding CsgD family transcriptional regulator